MKELIVHSLQYMFVHQKVDMPLTRRPRLDI